MELQTPEGPRQNMHIDHKLLAREFAEALAEKTKEWDEKHKAHHDALEQLIPYVDFVKELAEDLRIKRERREELRRQITGALIVAGALALCGWIGTIVLDYVDMKARREIGNIARQPVAEQVTQQEKR